MPISFYGGISIGGYVTNINSWYNITTGVIICGAIITCNDEVIPCL